jgi:Domain of unknown function (DUF397)
MGSAVNRGLSEATKWRRSSFCDGGACVEVAYAGNDMIAVRDSRDPAGAVTFGRSEWRNFVTKVKNGGYDIA